MNEIIKENYYKFQNADFDHDIIGIFQAIVNLMFNVRSLVDNNLFPPVDQPPENYYKLEPHLSRLEIRENYRNFLYNVLKEETDDEQIKLLNLYVSLVAGLYVYHMPVSSAFELSKVGNISRDVAKETLLNDNMSINWVKEPSNTDFTNLYFKL